MLILYFSLGSTRFFKVARAKSQEGLIVVKVFAIHDPSLPLSMYRDRIEEIKTKLSSANNCLPYKRVFVSCLRILHKYIFLFVISYIISQLHDCF